jgi:2-dehydropantoate 2-reductase
MKKTKIIIAGIGGVGGYFGGLLAKYYNGDEGIEIVFFARGEHLREIKKNGLKVIKADDIFIAIPALATDNPTEIGIADIILVCTKSYDLISIVQQLQPCIDESTIILPLLNGVNNNDKIQASLPNNIVLEGCVYIVSQIKQIGVVENIGNIQKIYFGHASYKSEKLEWLERIFNQASIEASYSKSISTTLWEKFIFLSPMAITTSYFNKSIGEVLDSPDGLATIKNLIEEVVLIAKAENISIANDVKELTLSKLQSFPHHVTSSMHIDFKYKKNNTELETLVGYVLLLSQKHKLKIPTYLRLYNHLKYEAPQFYYNKPNS